MGDKIIFPTTPEKDNAAMADERSEARPDARAEKPPKKHWGKPPEGRSEQSDEGRPLDEELLLQDMTAPQGGETRTSLLQKASRPPGFTLNSMLVGAIGLTILGLLGFIDVTLPSPLSLQTLDTDTWTVAGYDWMQYLFQIPVALFLGALLGPVAGTLAVLAYVGLGLSGMPLFSGGGGWAYVYQPGFGYLIGMIVGAYLSGKHLPGAFKTSHLLVRRSFKLAGVALLAVAATHLIGVLGIVVQWAFGPMSLPEALNWLVRLTVEPLPYDLLMAGILFCVVRQVRLCLWLVLY